MAATEGREEKVRIELRDDVKLSFKVSEVSERVENSTAPLSQYL